MLKPADPRQAGEERPIGEIVGDLVDEGKAYAKAELNLVKAMAAAKARALKTPAILLGAAAVLALAAVNALAVAVFVLLAMVMPPLLAAILAFALIGGTAGLLGWLGVRKLKDLA